LRSRLPDLKIVVGRWGQKENVEKVRERLQAAGADYVATSLLESCQQVLALIPVLETTAPGSEGKMPAGGKQSKEREAGSLASAELVEARKLFKRGREEKVT